MSKYLVKGNEIFNGKIPRYEATILYDNPQGSNGTITLTDDVSNYTYLEVYFFTNDGWQFDGYQKCMMAGNDATYHCLQYIHLTSANYYIKVRIINIQGTQISTRSSREIYNGGSSNSNNIYIRRVLGYK